MFSGLIQRFKKEITQLVDFSTKIDFSKYTVNPNSAWTGGAILASLSSFES